MGKKRKSPKQIAVLIRADVSKLSLAWRGMGIVREARIWGPVIAAVLDLSSRGPYPLGRRMKTWPGLDAMTLAAELQKHKLDPPHYNVEELLSGVDKRVSKIGPAEIGKLLCLDAKTRDELGIRNIYAFDQNAADRKKAAQLKKLTRDQARWKNRRDVYLANALANTRPWENEGISRPTWFRRKANAKKLRAQASREDNQLAGRREALALVRDPIRGESEQPFEPTQARRARKME